MKNIQKVSPPRDTRIGVVGLGRKLATLLAAFVLLMGTAKVAQAKDHVSQLQYLQWLVKVSGDTAQFNNNSTPQDYVQWALAKGMKPNGGWKPSHNLNQEQLAQTLVQFLDLNPNKKNADYKKILAREGIALVDALDDTEVTQKGITFLFDDIMFKLRLHPVHSPHKPPKPPHPPHPPHGGGDDKGDKN